MSVRTELIGALFSASLAAYLVYGPGRPQASETGFSLSMAGMQCTLFSLIHNMGTHPRISLV